MLHVRSRSALVPALRIRSGLSLCDYRYPLADQALFFGSNTGPAQEPLSHASYSGWPPYLAFCFFSRPTDASPASTNMMPTHPSAEAPIQGLVKRVLTVATSPPPPPAAPAMSAAAKLALQPNTSPV